MNRLWATLVCDVRLQWRNGFYYAAAVVTALFALLLAQTPSPEVRRLLPAVIVNNLIVNGFYFVGGLVLLEKGEGTLQAQVVTPLRRREYLAAKALSLIVLSLLENGILVLLLTGVTLQGAWLAAGITVGVLFYTFAGFAVVSRYDALNEYLLPSMLVVTALALPLLPYFGVGDTSLLRGLVYAHPLQPTLLMLQAAMGAKLALWQALYAPVYGALWAAIAFVAAHRAFERFIRNGAPAHG